MFNHEYSFDPTHGYDDAGLQTVAPPADIPDGFESFWRTMYKAALHEPLEIERRPCENFSSDEQTVEEVYFNAMGLNGGAPVRIGAWLTIPKHVEPVRGEVAGHGYGGRESPDLRLSQPPGVRLFVCTRGFHLSASDDLPRWAEDHVLHGIESRETYLHLGSVIDHWAATSVLIELFPQFVGKVDYQGGSFGGGIGILSCAWDDRIRRIAVEVPSFGNYPLRLGLPCSGSGQHVSRYAQDHPEVIDVLRYFDAATAARFVKQPTLVCAARFDPAVQPPGQVCVYNALGCDTKQLLLIDGGHFQYPTVQDDAQRYFDATGEWFAAGQAVVQPGLA